jgi:hypothetical protein
LTCNRQPRTSRQKCRFDEENFAAHLRPGHARRNSRRQFFARFFRVETWRTQIFFNISGVHTNLLYFILRDFQSGFANYLADGSLHLAHARLARVTRCD